MAVLEILFFFTGDICTCNMGNIICNIILRFIFHYSIHGASFIIIIKVSEKPPFQAFPIIPIFYPKF